jgi:glycosyltransferase involved in cell wall biosynthesis
MNHTGYFIKKKHLVWVRSTKLDELNATPTLSVTRELRKMEWQVTLIAAGQAGYRKIQGVEVLYFSRPDIYFLRQLLFYIKVIGWLFQNWKTIDVLLFDVMGAPWLTPLRFFRVLINQKRPIFVMDTRSVHMTDPSKENIRDRMRRLLYAVMQRWSNYSVDGRLAITQRMAELIRIPPKKLWGIWPSGVDPEQFIQAQNVRRWPSHNDAINIIYIGYTPYGRNLMSACKAVVQANLQGMKFTFSIYGDGGEQADLAKFAEQTSGQISINSPVPHKEVWKMLAQAHIGVLPFPDEPKYQVSSPIKLFEYMASGLPILATRIFCHTDVVGNGSYAFWADKYDVEGLVDAMRLVWQSRTILDELGSQAAIASKAWTWTASARKLKIALEKGLEHYG